MRRIGVDRRRAPGGVRRRELPGRIPALVVADRRRSPARPGPERRPGGLAGGRAADRPGPSPAVRSGDFVVRPGQRAQFNGANCTARLDSAAAPLLVDVRAAERYSGESEPIDPVAGHIPGAINLPSMANVDADGPVPRPGPCSRERYASAGAADGAVLYCGSGITAAHSLLAMESAGLTAAIYPGSWSEWITDPGSPGGRREQP